MSDESPAYYEDMKVQPIDAIRSALSTEQYTGFLIGNAIKYLMRFNAQGADNKGGLRDLRKARQYVDWAVEAESQS